MFLDEKVNDLLKKLGLNPENAYLYAPVMEAFVEVALATVYDSNIRKEVNEVSTRIFTEK